MDILFTTAELSPRAYPSGLKIDNIGYVPEKTNHVNRSFDSFNFSLILSGTGYYFDNGNRIPVQAPAVLTQRPGRIERYGPDDAWEELYFIYSQENLAQLQARRFWPPPAPCWTVKNPDLFYTISRQICERVENKSQDSSADLLDRLTEMAIFSAFTVDGNQSSLETSVSKKVKALWAEIKDHFPEPVDWNEKARSIGMSESTLRRQWQKQFGAPPASFLNRRRMERAACLLVTGSLPIQSIAQQIGFPDPLHFSRVFRKHYGTAPREYRKNRS